MAISETSWAIFNDIASSRPSSAKCDGFLVMVLFFFLVFLFIWLVLGYWFFRSWLVQADRFSPPPYRLYSCLFQYFRSRLSDFGEHSIVYFSCFPLELSFLHLLFHLVIGEGTGRGLPVYFGVAPECAISHWSGSLWHSRCFFDYSGSLHMLFVDGSFWFWFVWFLIWRFICGLPGFSSGTVCFRLIRRLFSWIFSCSECLHHWEYLWDWYSMRGSLVYRPSTGPKVCIRVMAWLYFGGFV